MIIETFLGSRCKWNLHMTPVILFQLSHSTLCRILRKIGYAYRCPGPSNTTLAHESQDMINYRLKYLITARAISHEIVYLDESYVNASHQDKRCWLKPESKVNEI